MIIFPRVVNAVDVLTTVSPVTHTELTDVNKESRKDKGTVCALGSINIPAPIIIKAKKLVEKIKAGEILTTLIILNNPDISVIATSMIAIMIRVFP